MFWANNTIKKNIEYVTCRKCNDAFQLDWGGKSKYTSCRYHYGNKVCKDCQLTLPASRNCYHIIQKSWFEWILSCFSS